MARILILGPGVQGTLYGVRLSLAGHNVTFVARGQRAEELRSRGAIIEHALTGMRQIAQLPIVERIQPSTHAEVCLVAVRREQLEGILPDLAAAPGILRVVLMVNHACGSEFLFSSLGRQRVVLAFPGAAGTITESVDRYVEVAEQPTAVEASAPDIAALLKGSGFRVSLVNDMDSWLRRHAVFVCAIAGALYETGVDVKRLSTDNEKMRDLIVAVREGWAAMDRAGVGPPPMALRAIFQWVPLPFSVLYWRRLIGSPQGEYYFARHTRHAPREMAALADDVLAVIPAEPIPHLRRLYGAIESAAAAQYR